MILMTMDKKLNTDIICTKSSRALTIFTLMLIFNTVFNMYVKGHHVYRDIWTPQTGESIDAQVAQYTNTLCVYEN